MEHYTVTGMSCAACSARVEKAVSAVPGVTSCSVSLLTNSMGVEGSATPDAVISAVQAAGYGASLKGAAQSVPSIAEQEDALADHETPVLKRRLIASLSFLIVLMYFSMGHMMWGWPLPSFFDGNHVAMGLIQMLLTIAVMVINQKFFINGFKSLFHGAPNMDTLVALGATASFGYSTYALFAMTGAQVRGDAAAMSLSSFCVVSNALRLNLFKLHDAGKDKKIKKKHHKEETTMEKTMKIEGMMCGHCEAAVKKALEAVDGVVSAEVSHTSGTAVVTLSKPVDSAVLKKAVEDKDYKVTSIEG